MSEYCKMLLILQINFLHLAAQKHICGLLNLRLADAHLPFLYCTKLTSYYIYKQLGSTKTKQASHILQYITHLHQQIWSK